MILSISWFTAAIHCYNCKS